MRPQPYEEPLTPKIQCGAVSGELRELNARRDAFRHDGSHTSSAVQASTAWASRCNPASFARFTGDFLNAILSAILNCSSRIARTSCRAFVHPCPQRSHAQPSHACLRPAPSQPCKSSRSTIKPPVTLAPTQGCLFSVAHAWLSHGHRRSANATRAPEGSARPGRSDHRVRSLCRLLLG